MTANQVAYWNLVESRRSNQAREREEHRSNVSKENETQRHNLQAERTIDSEIAKNKSDVYKNYARGTRDYVGSVTDFMNLL